MASPWALHIQPPPKPTYPKPKAIPPFHQVPPGSTTSSCQALLYFEAYFYPPWPTDFQGLSEDALQDEDTLDWTKKKEAFIECNEARGFRFDVVWIRMVKILIEYSG